MKVKRQTKTLSNKEKKRRERKAKTLAEKKTKAERRQNLIDTCKSNFVTDESLVKLLKSSRNIGQNKQTKKERLQEAFYREKLGLKVSDERELVQEVEVDDTAIPVVAPISGITYRKPEPIKPAKIADMEELFEAPVLRVSVPAPKASGPYIPVKSDTLDHEMFKGNADPTKAEDLKIKEHVKSYRPAEVEESRKSLPIINYERELLESVDSNLFTIVVGETGSGKSTQVPQILYEAGYAKNGLIGVTQPRRVAAISLSQRVGHELGLKNRVSHQVRYDASVTAETSIKFMTDGILLREICGDLLVSQYSVIVIDEAHERGVNTDILLGLLSRIAFLREKTDIQLKVIIMSATLRLDDFLSNPMLFQDIKPTVISVEARQHPVDIHYQKSTEETGVMDNCFRKVCKINNKLPEGGVLVFLPGKKDVLEMVSRLRAEIPAAKVLPLYSMLSPKKQMRVFETQEEGERVIIVSTNVAETSLTIPGIRYVVDSGLEKVKVFNNKLQLSQYQVVWVSQASASQRSGRAGRVGPGHCYRLYSYAAYGVHFEQYRLPEIQRVPLESTILLLKALGIKSIASFPFPTPPDLSSLAQGTSLLRNIGALDTKGIINSLGREMAYLPINPRFSKMILTAISFKVVKWVVLVVAGMATEQLLVTDSDQGKSESKRFHSQWFCDKSDCLGFLRILGAFLASDLSDVEFCEQFRLNLKSLREACDLAGQIWGILGHKPDLSEFKGLVYPDERNERKVLKSIVSGFVDQVARIELDPNDPKPDRKSIRYVNATPIDPSLFTEQVGDYIYIHPSSYLYRSSPPEFICYQELMFTKRPCVRNITEVDTNWLAELGGELVTLSEPLPAPSPFYRKGHVKAWVSPTFGEKQWKLQAYCIRYPEGGNCARWFLRFLMSGTLSSCIKKEWFAIKSTNVTNLSASGTQMRISRIVESLAAQKITTSRRLRQALKASPTTLVEELSSLVKPESRADFAAAWEQLPNIL